MDQQYEKLFAPLTLNNEVTLASRFVMAPMVVNGSDEKGYVGEDDLAYFARRSKTASMLITGATAVAPLGNAFGYGLASLDDSYLEGLTKLAATMKKDGGKAILQLYHSGREARVSFKTAGKVFGPTGKQFPFLKYPVTEMTEAEIEEMINSFEKAAIRAIQAGFDGVEIHGANHYLLQQFFSKLANERTDQWGGSIENRARLTLTIIKRVKAAIEKHGNHSFILGYRISPEEIHGKNIGYTLDDALYLIDQVATLGVDYVHASLWGPKSYQAHAQKGEYEGLSINQAIKKVINQRTAQIVVGDITSPAKALDALNYGDLIALASTAILEPDFKEKIAAGKMDQISFDVTERVADLKLPQHFNLMSGALENNGSVPEQTLELLRK